MMQENGNKARLYLLAVYGLIYGLMVYFTWLTPWIADDFVFDQTVPFSFVAISKHNISMYFHWGGRFIAYMINDVLLLSNHWLHVFLTPLIFTGIIFLGLMLLWGTDWRKKMAWWQPLVLFGLFWFFVPAFGEDFLWRTGAGVYCYPLFFTFLFLVPFRFLLDTPTYVPPRWTWLLMPLLGFAAGMGNENWGLPVFLAAAATVAWARRASGRWAVWSFAGLALCVAGWILLVVAPGNYERLAVEKSTYMKLALTKRILSYLGYWGQVQLRFLLPTLTVIGGCVRLLRQRVFPRPVLAGLAFFVMAQLACGAFFFSVAPSKRALCSIGVAICLSAAVFLFVPLWRKKIRIFLCALILIPFLFSLGENIQLFYQQSLITTERLALLEKGQGQAVTLPRYIHKNANYFCANDLKDMDVDWVKRPVMRNYGVRDIALRDRDGKKVFFSCGNQKIGVQRINDVRMTAALDGAPKKKDDGAQKNSSYALYYIPAPESIGDRARAFLARLLTTHDTVPPRFLLRLCFKRLRLPWGKPAPFEVLDGKFDNIRYVVHDGKLAIPNHEEEI